MLMGQRSSRMKAQLAAAPPHLTDDIYAEILVRLPVKSVLRFRAVCKAWRDMTTRPLFLAANARRQPAKVVLYTYLDPDSGQRGYDIALDVLPVSGGEPAADLRRLIRYHRSSYSTDPFLLDSCNGVLLFRKHAAAAGTYFLCNPVTRQWAELPKLTDDQSYGGGLHHHTVDIREFAFYFHQQSGEYRLLCRCDTWSAAGRTWCILSTGAAERRRVDPHAAGDHHLVPDTPSETTPVALHDSMHWPPRRPRGSSSSSEQGTTEMVAFDVQSEKFRLMAGPRVATGVLLLMKLFVMHGTLVAANFGPAKKHVVDLWFLVDYDTGRWERRHQVPTPWQSIPDSYSNLWSTAAACDDQGNIMLGSQRAGRCLLVYNVRMKTVRAVKSLPVAMPRNTNNVLVSRHVFRESLVEHPNFKRPSSSDLPFIHFWC